MLKEEELFQFLPRDRAAASARPDSRMECSAQEQAFCQR